VFDPKIETKTTQHYSFIKKQFCDAYISEEEFMKREDLFIAVIRNANHIIVGACLVKDSIEEDKQRISYPSSYLRYNSCCEKDNLLKKPITPTEKLKKVIFGPQLIRRYRFEYIDAQHKINRVHVYRVVFTLIDEYYRGNGYNQILLNFVYEKAAEHGNVKKILASIRESNIPSLKSFEKNGYSISKLKQKPYKNGEEKIRVYKFVFRKMVIQPLLQKQPEDSLCS